MAGATGDRGGGVVYADPSGVEHRNKSTLGRRWQTTFSVEVSRVAAPRVLSVVAAALVAQGAQVKQDLFVQHFASIPQPNYYYIRHHAEHLWL